MAEPILSEYDVRRCTEEAEHGQLTLPDRVLALARSHEALRAELDKVGDFLNDHDAVGAGGSDEWLTEPGSVIVDALRDFMDAFHDERRALNALRAKWDAITEAALAASQIRPTRGQRP